MQIKIFTIPVMADEQDVEELNHFLRSHKIIDVRRELTQTNGNNCWTFCVTYMPDVRRQAETEKVLIRQGKIDYKEVLDGDTFERFSRMRKLRKQIAENEAIPAYAVFTDAELAEIAKLEKLDFANLQKIPGIGKKKVDKYGNAFCMIDSADLENETSGTSDRTDCRPG